MRTADTLHPFSVIESNIAEDFLVQLQSLPKGNNFQRSSRKVYCTEALNAIPEMC